MNKNVRVNNERANACRQRGDKNYCHAGGKLIVSIRLFSNRISPGYFLKIKTEAGRGS